MEDKHFINSSKGPNNSEAEAEQTIPRFCYRKNFPPFDNSTERSDRGWGCCYRCLQGILANFFLRMVQDSPRSYRDKFSKVPPLDLFRDTPHSAFSIHSLVSKTCEICHIRPGIWAKPSQLTLTVRSLFGNYGISVFTTRGSNEISTDHTVISFPALVLAPTLFSLNKIELNHLGFLKKMLNLNQSLGFISGKSGSAYYFIGYDGNKFAFFDPHVTYQGIGERDPFGSFFELPLKKLPENEMNPSVLLAFYAKDQEDVNFILNSLMETENSPFSPEIKIKDDLDDIDCLEF